MGLGIAPSLPCPKDHKLGQERVCQIIQLMFALLIATISNPTLEECNQNVAGSILLPLN